MLPTQLGLHLWPQWSMVLGRRVDYLSPTLYLTDVIIFLLCISKTSLFTFHFSIKKRSFQLSILLFLFIVLNIVLSSSPWVALYKWIKVIEFAALGFYVYKTKPQFSSVVFYLSIGALFSAVIAIAQFIMQRSVGLWILGERTFSNISPGIAQYNFCWSPTSCRLVLRSYGTFSHPNVLGGFLAAVLPLAIREFSKGKKLFYTVVLTLGIVALVLTFSRSAWIAALLGIGIVYRKQLFFFVLPLLLFIGLTFGFHDESVVVRQQLNASAITMFLRSPITGIGLGNFLTELPKTLTSRQIYFLQPVHNIYLLLLSETGIIGFAILIWVLTKIKSITRYSLYIILFLGLVDHYSLTIQQGQLLFTILLAASTIGS